MNNSLLDVLKKAREQLKQQLQQEPEVGHGPRFDEIQESGMARIQLRSAIPD